MEGLVLDDEVNERFKAIRRELRDIEEELEKLRKKKAESVDVEALVHKISSLETEVRLKHASQDAGAQELRDMMRRLIESVDQMSKALEREKKETAAEVSDLRSDLNAHKDSVKGSIWEKIPKLAYVLMGIGVLAIMQQGPNIAKSWGWLPG